MVTLDSAQELRDAKGSFVGHGQIHVSTSAGSSGAAGLTVSLSALTAETSVSQTSRRDNRLKFCKLTLTAHPSKPLPRDVDIVAASVCQVGSVPCKCIVSTCPWTQKLANRLQLVPMPFCQGSVP